MTRLPHAGPARLLQRLVSFDPPSRVAGEMSLDPADPRLNAGGWLPWTLLVELMAQAGGLLIDDDGAAPGDYAVLAGVRRMHLHGAPRAGETVVVECSLARRLGDLYLIDCRAATPPRELAHGSLQIRRIRKAPA